MHEERFNEDPGAVIAALVAKDVCLLIRQPDRPTPAWKFPGGKVEKGESIERALVREVSEETGFEIPFVMLSNGDIFLGSKGVTVTKLHEREREYPRPHLQHFYLVEVSDPVELVYLDGKLRREDEGETIETKVFRLDVLKGMDNFLGPQRFFTRMLFESLTR